MALNIGNIVLGMGIDTTPLRKGLRALQDFQKINNDIAKSQKKEHQAQVAMRAKQEQAIRRVVKPAAELRQQLGELAKEKKISTQTVGAFTKAFNTFSQRMASGKLNMIEFNRTIDEFNAKMTRYKKVVSEAGETTQKASKQGADWVVLLRDLESSAVLAWTTFWSWRSY
jgi:chromosome segregation ATPase